VPTTVNGVPAHILIVHAVVVLIPLAALLAIVAACWPAARRRAGVVTPALAVVAAASVPLATNSGEWLQEHVAESSLVRHHVSLGDGLTPFAGLLLIFTIVLWLLDFAPTRRWPMPTFASASWVRPVVSALVVVVAVGALVQVYRIGDSGAKAAWDHRLTQGGGSGG